MGLNNFDVSLYLVLFVFAVLFISSFIHSSVGFGFSILSMTVLPIFLDLISVAVVIKITMLLITSMMAIKLRDHINFRFIILPTTFLIIGNTFGFYLLMNLETDILKVILGIVLVVLGSFNLIFKKKYQIRKSIPADIFFGFLAGVIGGMFNLAGIVLVIYFYSAIEDKLEYAATMQAAFAITATYGAFLHLVNGNFSDPNVILLTGVSIVAVLIGCFLGLKVLQRISKEMIGVVSYTYMVVMGVLMVFRIS